MSCDQKELVSFDNESGRKRGSSLCPEQTVVSEPEPVAEAKLVLDRASEARFTNESMTAVRSKTTVVLVF